MVITRNDINLLKKWSTTSDLVPVDSIPASLKPDFQIYFFGKTLLEDNDVVYAYPHDIKGWVGFIFKKYND
jgi:hypothetical protein